MTKCMTKSGIRLLVLAAACGLVGVLSACSDNATQEDSPAKEAPGQSAPVKSAEAESKPATDLVPSSREAAPAPGVPDGSPCVTILTAKCTECHSTERICEKLGKKSKSRWQRTVTRMIERGAKVTPAEAATLLDCLDSGPKALQAACQ